MMFQQFARSVLFVVLALALSSSARAAEPVLLRYKLEKGSSLIGRVKVDTKTTQTLLGMNIETAFGQEGIDVREVDDSGENETAKIKTKTVRLKGTAKIPGLGDYEFDSQKTERDRASTLGAALTPLHERLVGSELQMEVNSRGVVQSYTGYAQLVGDLIKANPLTAQFAGGGSDNAAKMGAQGQWVVFPEKPIKPGEKWENPLELELPGLGVIKGKETITFLMIEEKDGHSIAKFTTSSDISFDANIDMGTAKVTGKVTTTNSSGTAEFDMTAGRLLKQNSSLTLTGQLSVNANGAVIPVDLNQTTTIDQVALDKVPE